MIRFINNTLFYYVTNEYPVVYYHRIFILLT